MLGRSVGPVTLCTSLELSALRSCPPSQITELEKGRSPDKEPRSSLRLFCTHQPSDNVELLKTYIQDAKQEGAELFVVPGAGALLVAAN